jgi:hypothetical protein
MLPQHVAGVEFLAHAEPRREPTAVGGFSDADQMRGGGFDQPIVSQFISDSLQLLATVD